MVERARELERSGVDPARPRLAASVVLLRDSPSGVETYLLHRHARMAFAPSMVVFPGGKVDPVDGPEQASAVVACALRETEEETGVRLVADGLRPWAHWVTPEPEPLRYDTHFFVATLPAGQTARDLSGETERAAWTSPRLAVQARTEEKLAMLPPTWSILLELAEADRVADVMAAADGRLVRTVLPRLVNTGSGWRFSYPVERGRDEPPADRPGPAPSGPGPG